MFTFKEFTEKKKCPPGYKYDEKLKVCVPKFRKYAYYGRIGPGPKQEPQNTSGDQGNGNGNGNGNAGNGNGNGATPGNGGNGGNGGGE
mgnify:CR=1 FL=1|tara:strand:- start:578 stop:841 length:264 start_codon:yes stop_codon:yes gene_type:complete